MKKHILLLIPTIALVMAIIGYSYTSKKRNNQINNKQLNEKCQTCTISEFECNSDKSKCEPCKACEICPPCKPCEPCCTKLPKTGQPYNCAYNAPARINPVCGWQAWITASFIYWQPKEKGLNLGYIHIKDITIPNKHFRKKINLDFDYHPSFKVGTGMSFKKDDWTLYLEYTRLKSKDSTTKDIKNIFNPSAYELVTPWLGNLSAEDNYHYLKAKWEIDYNMFDLELGRPYYLSQ